jgi:hypothetical protein
MTPRPKPARKLGRLQAASGSGHASVDRRPAVAMRRSSIQAQSGVNPVKKAAIKAARPKVRRQHDD